MLRRLYQTTLFALQLALLVQLAPPLAHALRVDAAFGAFPHGWLAAAQVASAAGAVAGGTLALAFPGLALLRHRQRGSTRFGGLPRWAIALALAGAAIFVVGIAVNGIVPLLAPDARLAAVLAARPALNAGLALMAAGVLCAELLRRSIGVPRIVVVPGPMAPERVEVTHPSELTTVAT